VTGVGGSWVEDLALYVPLCVLSSSARCRNRMGDLCTAWCRPTQEHTAHFRELSANTPPTAIPLTAWIQQRSR
jgi:hypothetical protein